MFSALFNIAVLLQRVSAVPAITLAALLSCRVECGCNDLKRSIYVNRDMELKVFTFAIFVTFLQSQTALSWFTSSNPNQQGDQKLKKKGKTQIKSVEVSLAMSHFHGGP